MLVNRARLVAVELRECLERDQVLDFRVIHPAYSTLPRSASRSLINPARIRLFTVPSGMLVRSAISDCERSEKYASRSKSRSPSFKVASAPSTLTASLGAVNFV